MVRLAQRRDHLPLDEEPAPGALCAEVRLVALGAEVVLPLREEAPLRQRAAAPLAPNKYGSIFKNIALRFPFSIRFEKLT